MSIGKAVPYGIYDVALNRGCVNVGTSHDTPDFAVESIRMWWEQEGRTRYPLADSLLVLADSGGSNSARSRLWKVRLQGRPLVDFETIISLIGATSTTSGLTVTAQLDLDTYPTGVKIPDAVMAQLALQPHTTHPQWNYSIAPRAA